MRISPTLVGANLFALAVNALVLLLAVLRICSWVLPLLLFVGCLLGLVWLSCWINGRS